MQAPSDQQPAADPGDNSRPHPVPRAGRPVRWLCGLVVLAAVVLAGVYLAFSLRHPDVCQWGRRLLDRRLDALSTLVLVLGSIALAVAVRAAKSGKPKRLRAAVALALLCGLAFLGLRAVDYRAKWKHRLLAGRQYRPTRKYLEATLGRPLGLAETTPAPPTAARPPAATGPADPARGRQLFLETCAACHGASGQGVLRQGADLVHSKFVKGQNDGQLLNFIKAGRQPNDPQSVLNLAIPARGGNPSLGDAQLRDVVAFLRQLQQEGKSPAGQATAKAGAGPVSPAAPPALQELVVSKTVIPVPALGLAGLARFHRPPEPPAPIAPPERPQDFFTLFFVLTGFHLACAVVGVGLAVTAGMRLWRMGNQDQASVSLAGAAAYGHTVCAVWVVLVLLFHGTG